MPQNRRLAPSRGPGPALAVTVAAAVVLAGVMIWAGSRTQRLPAPAAPGAAGSTSLGLPSAPVTVEVFSDFRCGYCSLVGANILAPLARDYVDSGKVQVKYRFYPFLGPQSRTAALGAACAADQGRFWVYHDLLFANLRTPLDDGRLRALAAEAGLDRAAWSRCFTSAAISQRVDRELAEARGRGVEATPSFIITSGQFQELIRGLPAYEQMAEVIEQALQQS